MAISETSFRDEFLVIKRYTNLRLFACLLTEERKTGFYAVSDLLCSREAKNVAQCQRDLH